MQNRYIPASVMLAAGLICAIVSIRYHWDVMYSLITLLLVLLVFYCFGVIAGRIIRKIQEANLAERQAEAKRLEEEWLEKERLEEEQLEEERLEQERLEKEKIEQVYLEQERLEKERFNNG